MENRHVLIVDAMLTTADGTAEDDAELLMTASVRQRRPTGKITVGADKAYDQQALVQTWRELGVVPHVAQNNRRWRSAIDGRTVRHTGYAISQKKRPLIEKVFGWLKPDCRFAQG